MPDVSVAKIEDSVRIPAGTKLSTAFDLGENIVGGFFLPANFDGAGIKIYAASQLQSEYLPLQDDSGDLVLAGAAGTYIAIPSISQVIGIRFLKVESDTNQSSGDAVIRIAKRKL